MPSVLASLDQPLADQALMPLHAVAEFARREVTVAIGGEGADELFGGYPRYRWLSRRVPLGRPPAGERAAGGRGPRLGAREGGAPVAARRGAVAPVAQRPEPGLDLRAPPPPSRRAVRARPWPVSTRTPSRQTLAARAHSLNGVAPATALMHADQLQWLPDDVLMKADRAGMLVSLEVRTPYLHRELAEFAGTVSLQHHLEPTGKSILRELLGNALPERPIGRKTAFRAPASGWLRGPLAPLFEDQLRSGAVYSEGWLDRTAVRRMFERHRDGSGDFAFALWPVLALGRLARRVQEPRLMRVLTLTPDYPPDPGGIQLLMHRVMRELPRRHATRRGARVPSGPPSSTRATAAAFGVLRRPLGRTSPASPLSTRPGSTRRGASGRTSWSAATS